MDYLEDSKKTLSNNFLGKKKMYNYVPKNIREGIGYDFGMTIKTSTISKPAGVALLTGHYPTLSVVSGELVHNDKTEISKAISGIDVIADDAQVAFGGGHVTIAPKDPTKTIRSFLQFIRTNPMMLTHITLASDNVMAYDGKIKLQRTNPFTDPETVNVDLSRFFDVGQFQTNKIEMDLIGSELEVSDVMFFMLFVPPSSEVVVTMRFAIPLRD